MERNLSEAELVEAESKVSTIRNLYRSRRERVPLCPSEAERRRVGRTASLKLRSASAEVWGKQIGHGKFTGL